MLAKELVLEWVLFKILDELQVMNAILAHGLKVPESVIKKTKERKEK